MSKFKLVGILFIITIIIGGNLVFASGSYDDATKWWESAYGFLEDYEGTDTTVGVSTVGEIIKFLDPLVNLLKMVGNTIFVIVTVILGVKYIWGGVESKTDVKESLITIVIAALVFYGWTSVSALLQTGNNLSFVSSSLEDTTASVYQTIIYICNYLAIGGIVYIGIRYMLAGAEGKAELKTRGVPITLGLIMVYATLTFLNFIVGFI